jgi:hypothetical protein
MRGTEICDIKRARFTEPLQFWTFLRGLTAPNYTVWVVCHNAIFDLVVSGLTEWHARSEIIVDWPRSKRKRETNADDDPHQAATIILNAPPVIVAMRDVVTQGRFVVLDTLNWFPASLAEIGTTMEMEKYPMPAFSASDDEWFEYCERDSWITFHAFTELINWVRVNDMGMFRYTGPAQAMAAFRHRFMSHDILMHDNTDVKNLERRSYFGGRTEVFRLGEIRERVYQIDVNSLFPSVMENELYPAKLDRYEIREEYLPLHPDIRWADSIAEVTIRTMNPAYPKRGVNQTTYPIGSFATVLAGAELAHAQAAGCITSVRSWSEYTTAPLFTLWVRELWDMRQRYKASGNNLYADFCKRLMNSLYGKFAQMGAEWVNDPDVAPLGPFMQWHHINSVSGEVTEYRSFGWTTQRMETKRKFVVRPIFINGQPGEEIFEECHELENTFVAISAFVTSYARRRMDQLRLIAGTRNVYYQGVDGLIVSEPGFLSLQAAGEIQADKLGKLRPQCVVDDGQIYGCSDYRLADKIVISGKARATIDSETGEVMQRKFAGVSMLFRGAFQRTIEETLSPWRRQSDYTKGIPQADGWVDPLVLSDC